MDRLKGVLTSLLRILKRVIEGRLFSYMTNVFNQYCHLKVRLVRALMLS